MSEIGQLTHKAVSMNAALASLGTDPEWDQRVAEYLRLNALQSAVSEYGALGEAAEEHAGKRIEAQAIFGHGWYHTTEGRAFIADACAKVAAAEEAYVEQYLRPFWDAARALALTPAPNLQAAAYKAFLIEADEIWNAKAMPDCVQIVADDFARVMGNA